MDNINVTNYTFYTINIYHIRNWEFDFLSNDTNRKIESICTKFREYIYKENFEDDEMKDKFFEFLTKSKVNYICIQTKRIIV